MLPISFVSTRRFESYRGYLIFKGGETIPSLPQHNLVRCFVLLQKSVWGKEDGGGMS